jgi:uncharacterized protein YhbP (UPF0306 family)
MPPALPAAVAAYLDEHHVMTLATHSADGPWAAAVFYVRLDHGLYFMSSPSSRHGRDLAADPRCAAAVQANETDWARIKGVQMQGRVSTIEGAEQARALLHYAARFPFIASPAAAPAAIAVAMAKVRWYRLRIERLFFIDNSRGFGQRERIDLDGA